jgi:two-component system, chemotaxis family, sensor kinase CheA
MTEPRRAKYVALFATEARSLLAGGRRTLEAWRDTPADAAPAEELFRVLHTIKGMAASLDFSALAERVHDVETTLGEVRAGARVADRGWLALLAQELDDIAIRCEDAILAEGGEAVLPGAQVGPSARIVRVDLDRLDRLFEALGSLVTARQELDRTAAADALSPVARAAQALGRHLDRLQDDVLAVRLAPLAEVFERLPPVARDLARQLGKEVDVVVGGDDLEVDRAVLDLLPEPLLHLLRNAVGHGLESPEDRRAAGKRPVGRLTIQAHRDRDAIVLEVRDDGRGIDRDRVAKKARAAGITEGDEALGDDALLAILARPGFSTASEVTELSGRGVGLDTVVARLHAVGASLTLTTIAGRGTAFTIRLPTRLGIVRSLVTGVGTERYALPLTHVHELVAWDPSGTRLDEGRTVLRLRDEWLPVLDLRRLLLFRGEAPPSDRPAVVFEANGHRIALLVDRVIGQVDAVIQPIERPQGMPRWITGATVLDDGRPALLLDLASVV